MLLNNNFEVIKEFNNLNEMIEHVKINNHNLDFDNIDFNNL
jgi:hypothetical protein